MKFNRLVALFPCQNLEDFDLHRKEEDADGLLSAWSALWHPAIMAAAQTIPSWITALSPPVEPADCLIVVPGCCEPLLPAGWMAEAETAGAAVLHGLKGLDETVARMLARTRVEVSVDADLVSDFLALGYCYFQVELIARKSSYATNLDTSTLQTAALAAAHNAVLGNVPAAREHLQAAFDRLHEAREYSHPTEPRLLDLTLLASSTVGSALREELAAAIRGPTGARGSNLLVSGEVIEHVAEREPDTLELLKESLAAGVTALVGGEYTETPLSLLDPEAIRAQLRRGLAAYHRHLSHRPLVFGRRRFGLSPAMPQVLDRLGFTAALGVTLDDGRFPTSNQTRIQWEGIDGTTIESLAAIPLDAGRAASMLVLADKLADAVQLHDSATILLAHWPSRSCRWYELLRRIATYGSVLGRFFTIGSYFEETSYSYQRGHYQPDEYRPPYLRQDAAAGRRDPITQWVRYFRRRAMSTAWKGLRVLAAVAGAQQGDGRRGKTDDACGVRKDESPSRNPQPDEFDHRIDDALGSNMSQDTAIDNQLANLLSASAAEFSAAIARSAAAPERGFLAINPWSFGQPVRHYPSSLISRPSPFLPPPQLLDVPAMGFAWVADNEVPQPAQLAPRGWFGSRKRQEPPPLAEQNLLRNEFCEVRFDACTGAIRAVSDYHSRDPRLSQQIAFRLSSRNEPDEESNYSIMAADEVTVTSAGPALGEMVCRGRLMDREGRRVAAFRQTTRVWRGSPIIEILVDLEIDRLPEHDPWQSYYAIRFAWKDETATLVRSVNMAGVPTELEQIESPYFLDVQRQRQHTTLLCCGLPYHRRCGPRKLDTLLVVNGETARSFRVGIGVDVPQPLAAALGMLAPPLIVPDHPPPSAPAGWLFHLDCRNVLATDWAATEKGGFRVRLLETEGRGVQLGLRCFGVLRSAWKINPGDMPPTELRVAGDRIEVFVAPYQWIEIEASLEPRPVP